MAAPPTVRLTVAPILADWDLGWVVTVAAALTVAALEYTALPSAPLTTQRYFRPWKASVILKEKVAVL